MKTFELKKLIYGMSIWVLFLIFFLLAMVLISFDRMSDSNNTLSDDNDTITILYEAEIAHYKWSQELLISLLTGAPFTGELDPEECMLGTYMYSSENKNNDIVTEMRKSLEKYHDAVHEASHEVLMTLEEDTEAALAIYVSQFQPNLEKLRINLEDLLFDAQKRIDESEEDYSLVNLSALISIVTSLFLLSLTLLFYFRSIRKDVLANLIKVEGGLEQLSIGNLNNSININSKFVEINKISDKFNFSIQELAKYINETKKILSSFAKGDFTHNTDIKFIGDFEKIILSIEAFREDISKLLIQITDSSGQLSRGAEDISRGAQSLSQGAEDQNQSICHLSDALEEITTQIKESSEFATNAQKLGEQSSLIIKNNSSKMNGMINAINKI
ncbi:hypothetical protein AN642_00945 [Epulopiscium sp. SCG-B10WGA-EpuloA2]|nr:hypothetical protein AN642_00945 [Epulopiscium sp. SCG-B10WGA-EpuloA2]